MLTVISGKAGTGKTTALKEFERLGYQIISSSALLHQVAQSLLDDLGLNHDTQAKDRSMYFSLDDTPGYQITGREFLIALARALGQAYGERPLSGAVVQLVADAYKERVVVEVLDQTEYNDLIGLGLGPHIVLNFHRSAAPVIKDSTIREIAATKSQHTLSLPMALQRGRASLVGDQNLYHLWNDGSLAELASLIRLYHDITRSI